MDEMSRVHLLDIAIISDNIFIHRCQVKMRSGLQGAQSKLPASNNTL